MDSLSHTGSVCVASHSTKSYLHQAITALSSFSKHNPEIPAFLLVIDGEADLKGIPKWINTISAGEIDFPDRHWHTLRFSPADFCGMHKLALTLTP